MMVTLAGSVSASGCYIYIFNGTESCAMISFVSTLYTLSRIYCLLPSGLSVYLGATWGIIILIHFLLPTDQTRSRWNKSHSSQSSCLLQLQSWPPNFILQSNRGRLEMTEGVKGGRGSALCLNMQSVRQCSHCWRIHHPDRGKIDRQNTFLFAKLKNFLPDLSCLIVLLASAEI